MYEFECLTAQDVADDAVGQNCSPFSGGCYPEAEGHCGPECSPN